MDWLTHAPNSPWWVLILAMLAGSLSAQATVALVARWRRKQR